MSVVARRHRPFILRLLLALMLLAALAPSISRAAAAWVQQHQPWQVVCHAGAPDGAAGGHAPAGLAGMDGGCAFCLLRGDGAPPPAAAVQPALPDGLRHGLPNLFLQAPAPLFAWRPAQARAPPRRA